MKTATKVETEQQILAAPPGLEREAEHGCLGFCHMPRAAALPSLTWAATSLEGRLRILRGARHRMATQTAEFAAAISPQLARNQADTLVAELLPLLDACRFLERNAARILAPRKLGMGGRPLWLTGVRAEVHREPFGHILIVGPSNFPLFVPGAQVLQALAAGNTVTWKPGAGGAGVAQLVASALEAAGLPAGALTVTDESVEAAQAALAGRPDKVIFTGSEAAGRSVLQELAKSSTPSVVELSGADAILVMPSADLAHVARAVAFGLRLNGAAVCISPRRLFASPSTLTALLPLLHAELAEVPPIALEDRTAARLQHLLFDAMSAGATVHGDFAPSAQRPLLVSGVTPQTAITRTDIFAPVISLLPSQSMLHTLEQYAQSPYALSASIFCGPRDEAKACSLAGMLKAGTVLINDVIAPTADPRVPFGGRGISGHGVTRGEEGLLEMTAVKTLLVRSTGFGRRGLSSLHMQPLRDADTAIFSALIGILHGKGLAARWNALKRLIASARR